MRVGVLDFLDTDVFNITPESCAAFLDPLIVSWDIDLASFGLEIVLNRRIAPAHLKKFEFVERESAEASDGEPGLQEFLKDRSFNGDATLEEVEFLNQLRCFTIANYKTCETLFISVTGSHENLRKEDTMDVVCDGHICETFGQEA